MQYFAKLIGISIHAPRTGSDQVAEASDRQLSHFNPRSPHGERRMQPSMLNSSLTYFNPRSPHGERHHLPAAQESPSADFNPRSPHGERHGKRHPQKPSKHFNPRSPHGERRYGMMLQTGKTYHFNPRSPHGERLAPPDSHIRRVEISIHAPRTGSDLLAIAKKQKHIISIHAPRTGSDENLIVEGHGRLISIHAPRTGSDSLESENELFQKNFNPRSPHGERRCGYVTISQL